MKYMCMECRRIHDEHWLAERCCQPCVELIPNNQVEPCRANGENCKDETCVFCQGTGLARKQEAKS